MKLIKEEEELNDAFKVYDIVEIIDALSDILYVVYGIKAAFGINIDEQYHEYVSINLSENNNMCNDLTNFQLTKLLVNNEYSYNLRDFAENCKEL